MFKGLLIASLFVSSAAFATEVCLQKPDGVKYEGISANGDGSMTITEPRFAFDGKNLAISATSTGVCSLMKKSFGFAANTTMTKGSVVTLTADGKVSGVFAATTAAPIEVLSKVTCN